MEPLDIDCEPVVEVAEAEEIAVPAPYPNPFEDFINLPGAGDWTLMDITGKVVQHVPADGSSIATEELPAGCYLLRSESISEPRTYRMTKD
ncbi:MAG: T9SS type A sorting domain-containing protein [Flavobacteriales bacterium]